MSEQTTNDWITVDDSRYDSQKVIDAPHGIVVHLSVSPHEVPRLVRGGYDSEKRRFVLQFRYMDNEPLLKQRVDKHSNALIGKRSGRIYSLEIDVDSLNVGSVQLHMDVDRAIKDLAEGRANARPKHYETAKRVVNDYWNRLFAPPEQNFSHQLGI